MTSGDNYLFRAAEFFAKAESETNPEMRAGFENLARAYLRLAEQALRNAQTDIIYEPAPPKLDDPELKQSAPAIIGGTLTHASSRQGTRNLRLYRWITD
jgi:hypothetical protein